MIQSHETVTLIAPSPDTYALLISKQITGGGGGEHDRVPATEGIW